MLGFFSGGCRGQSFSAKGLLMFHFTQQKVCVMGAPSYFIHVICLLVLCGGCLLLPTQYKEKFIVILHTHSSSTYCSLVSRVCVFHVTQQKFGSRVCLRLPTPYKKQFGVIHTTHLCFIHAIHLLLSCVCAFCRKSGPRVCLQLPKPYKEQLVAYYIVG